MRFIKSMGAWTVVLLLSVTRQIVQANIIAPVQEQLNPTEKPEEPHESYSEPQDSVQSLDLTNIKYAPENETELPAKNPAAEGSQISFGISQDIKDDTKTLLPFPDIPTSTEAFEKRFPQLASANENSGGYYSIFAQPPDLEPNYETSLAVQDSNISGDEDIGYETFTESLKLDQIQEPREEIQDYDPSVEMEALFDHINSSFLSQASDLTSENEDFEYKEGFSDDFIAHEGKQDPAEKLKDESAVPEDSVLNYQSEDPLTELRQADITTKANIGIPTSEEHFLNRDLLHPDKVLDRPDGLGNMTQTATEFQNTTVPGQNLNITEIVDGFSQDFQIQEEPRKAKSFSLAENDTTQMLDIPNIRLEVRNPSATPLPSFTPFYEEGELLDPLGHNVSMNLTIESEIINDQIEAENSEQSQNQVSGLEFGESLQYTVASPLNFESQTPKTEFFDESLTSVSSTQEPVQYNDQQDSLKNVVQNPLLSQDRSLESEIAGESRESLAFQGTAAEQDQFSEHKDLSHNSYLNSDAVQDPTEETETVRESEESLKNFQESDQQSYSQDLLQNSTISPLISQGRSLETETIEESLESRISRKGSERVEFSDPVNSLQNQTPDTIIAHDSFEETERLRELNVFPGAIREPDEFSYQPDSFQNPTISPLVSQGRNLETETTGESLESRAFHRPVQEHFRLTEQLDSSRKTFPVPVALRNPLEETPVLKESQGILRPIREPPQFDDFHDVPRELPQVGSIRFNEDTKNHRELGKGTVPLFNPPARREANIALQPTPVEQSMPYQFSYTVKDPLRGTDFGHQEDSDGVVVTGQYYVVLPDGRRQTVQYKADGINGYQSAVEYKANTPDGQNSVSAGNFDEFVKDGDNSATGGQYQQGSTGDINGNQHQILSSGFDGGNEYLLIDDNSNINLHQGTGGDSSFVGGGIGSLSESSHNFQTLDSGNQFLPDTAGNIQYQNADSGNQNSFVVQGGNLQSDYASSGNEHQIIGNSQPSFSSGGDPFLPLNTGDQSQGFNDGNQFHPVLSSSNGDPYGPSGNGDQFLPSNNDEQYQLSDTEAHIQVSNAGDHLQPFKSSDSEVQHQPLAGGDQYQPFTSGDQGLPPTGTDLYPPLNSHNPFHPLNDNEQYQSLNSEDQYQPVVGSDQFLHHDDNQYRPPSGGNQYLAPSGSNPHLPPTGSDHFQPPTGDPFLLPNDGDQYDQFQTLDGRNKFHPFRGDEQYQVPNGDDLYQQNAGSDHYQPSGGGNQNQFFDDEFNDFKSTNDDDQYASSNGGSRFSPSTDVNHYPSSNDEHTHHQNIKQKYQPFTDGDQFHPLSQPPNHFEPHQPFDSSEKNEPFSTESHFQAFHDDQNEPVTEGHFHGDQNERIPDTNFQAFVSSDLYKPAKRHSHSQPCNCGG